MDGHQLELNSPDRFHDLIGDLVFLSIFAADMRNAINCKIKDKSKKIKTFKHQKIVNKA
jgi:hypothetical protein